MPYRNVLHQTFLESAIQITYCEDWFRQVKRSRMDSQAVRVTERIRPVRVLEVPATRDSTQQSCSMTHVQNKRYRLPDNNYGTTRSP